MFFELIGYALSSFAVAVLLAFKITRDIYPKFLKKKLIRIALCNWQKALINQFRSYNPENATTFDELGIFSSKDESEAELPKDGEDNLLFYGLDNDGNCLTMQMTKIRSDFACVNISLKMDSNTYTTSFEGHCENPHEFSLGTLKLEMVEGMRSWRLWYNGALHSENASGDTQLVHVVINVLWKAIEQPFDSMKNANTDLLSEYMTESGSFGANFTELSKFLPRGYYQFGAFHGTVKVDNSERDPLYLYGFRVRDTSEVQDSQRFGKENALMELFGMNAYTGDVFRLTGHKDGWTDGYVLESSFRVNPILSVEGSADEFIRNSSLPKLFSFNDKNGAHRIEIWPAVEQINLSNSEVVLLKLTINGEKGCGIILRRFNNGPSQLQSKETNRKAEHLKRKTCISYSSNSTMKDDIVGLDSEFLLPVSLVGGKASSLVQLSNIAKASSTYNTAKGFCVTTELFRKSVDLNKISELFAQASNDLDLTCNTVMDLIKSSDAELVISPLVKSWLESTFGSHSTSKYAVRSSGVLEDASDLSCAGQNETFLGTDAASVPRKIVECWASLFTPQSVHYRLNHGQPAVSEIGVVVQEMVNAAAAGVLFTADPLTGNPFEMIITANFGLGESVVSAASDPDTIKVLLSRKSMPDRSMLNSDFKIGTKSLGEKKTKIVLKTDGGATEEVLISETDSGKYCIGDDIALKLAAISVEIERECGQLKPIDIEWAVGQEGEIYILQSRAITSLDAWTDFELKHEFDTPLRTQEEKLTTANTGEVMPNTMYPLAVGVNIRLLDGAVQKGLLGRVGDPISPYMMRTLGSYHQRVFLNMFNVLYREIEKEITPGRVCGDFSMFGRKVVNEEIQQLSIRRFGVQTGKSQLKALLGAIQKIVFSGRTMKDANDKFSNYRFGYKNSFGDMNGLHKRISEEMYNLYEMMGLHSHISEVSVITQMFAFVFLSAGRKVEDWNSELYEDLSVVLSVCANVESADMPNAMEELANKIVNHGENLEEFIQSSGTEKALEWIRKQSVVQAALDKFFEKHGHRCICELDVGAKSWKTDPTPLFALLKNIVRNKMIHKDAWAAPTQKRTFANDDELLSALNTPVSNTTRRLLKFLMPSCRNAVLNRERTKSLLVWTLDQIKQAYYRLAELMVQEKLISDESVIFFLTHPEIDSLINKSSTGSRILYKAMRRQKLYTVMNADEYPEICEGYPEPVNRDVPIEITDSIQATPVSSGTIQGVIKVCKSVEEASELLRPGDILVTHGTDIAWSPFFPMLGGVVTELGGLISHGAVVAREYGLPCIVGAINATKIFKTGEQVLLDAGKGTLSKIKVSEEK